MEVKRLRPEDGTGAYSEDPKLGTITSAEISRYPDHPAPATGEEKALKQMEQRRIGRDWPHSTPQWPANQRSDKGLFCTPTFHFIPS